MDTPRLRTNPGWSFTVSDDRHDSADPTGSVTSSTTSWQIPYEDSREEIRGYRGPRQIGAMHGCWHYKRTSAVAKATLPITFEYTSTQWFNRPRCAANYLWATHGAPFGPIEAPTNSLASMNVDFNALSQRALVALLPGIRPAASLPNMLFELKDFKSLRRSISRVHTTLVAWNAAIANTKWQRWAFRDTLRALSDNYLQFKFNVSPLYSDIAAITRAIQALPKRIAWLERNQGKWLVRHYKADLPFEQTTEETGLHAYPMDTTVKCAYLTSVDSNNPVPWAPSARINSGGVKYRRVCSYSTAQFCATLQYSYTLTDYQRRHLRLNAYLDTLGIRLDPSIVWNALPWSFVVDWFTRVNGLLSSYAIPNVRPTVSIRGFACSSKVVRKIESSLMVGPTTHSSGTGWVLVSTVNEKFYERRVNLDTEILRRSLQFSGLNSQEFILTAALAGSRL